jgi:hypothetical protein
MNEWVSVAVYFIKYVLVFLKRMHFLTSVIILGYDDLRLYRQSTNFRRNLLSLFSG